MKNTSRKEVLKMIEALEKVIHLTNFRKKQLIN